MAASVLGFLTLLLGVLSTASASASAVVLYDQTGGTAGGFVPAEIVNEHGECDAFAGFNECYAADDFTVPPGPGWFVEGVHVDGRGSLTTGSWLIFSGGDLPSESESLLGGSPTSGGAKGEFTSSGDLSLAPPSLEPSPGVALAPGHYWLKVWGVGTTGQVSGTWAWQTQSPQSGSPAAWQDGAGPSGEPCAHDLMWHRLADCGLPGPDLRFRIVGEEMSGDFNKFELGGTRRMPSGGVEFPHVKLPGPSYQPEGVKPFQLGYLAVRKVSGPGQIESIAPGGHWKRVAGSYLTGPLKIKPTPKTKKLLKAGKVLKLRLAVTYRRESNNSVLTPARTEKVKAVLKKPGHHGRHRHRGGR